MFVNTETVTYKHKFGVRNEEKVFQVLFYRHRYQVEKLFGFVCCK